MKDEQQKWVATPLIHEDAISQIPALPAPRATEILLSGMVGNHRFNEGSGPYIEICNWIRTK